MEKTLKQIKTAQYHRNYRLKYPERVKELGRLARERHKEKRDAYYKEWKKNNPTLARERHLKARFNITPEEYDVILKKQQYQCAICLRPQVRMKRKLAVDHCHKTGKIRGLLCHSCNIGLGYFRDDILSLEYAVLYLKNSN